MRASRLLSLLILLQLRGRLTAEALAREFEVSVRTIHRDIDELSAAGVPVIGDRGPGGGFRLREEFRTRLDGLLPDEAQALPLLALPGAAGELGLGSAPKRLQAKLLASLPREAAALAGRLHERLHVDPLGWYQHGTPARHLPALARAVLDERRVALAYQSWKGERRWQVEPLGLVLKAGDWYAVVRHGARTMMLKAVHIRALEVLDDRFERPAAFELAAWWQAALLRFERELRPERARLRLSAEGRRRLAEHGGYAAGALAGATAPSDDGWAEVDLPIEHHEQAARLVLGLAAEVQVLAPAALRERVAALAREVAAAHRAPVRRIRSRPRG